MKTISVVLVSFSFWVYTGNKLERYSFTTRGTCEVHRSVLQEAVENKNRFLSSNTWWVSPKCLEN